MPCQAPEIDVQGPGTRQERPLYSLVRTYRPRLFLDWLLLLVICLLIPTYALYLHTPALGQFHDEGLYVVNALSLITGHGYKTLSLPAEPFQTKYPFLYPALLATLWKLFPSFPQNVAVFKTLSALGTLLWCAAIYNVVINENERGNRRLALWIAALTACSAWVLFLSASVLPDTLFCFFTTAAIGLLARATRSGHASTLDVIVGSVLTGLAFLVRTAGLPLIVAAIVMLLIRRRFGACGVFLAVIAVMSGPWLVWQWHHPGSYDAVQNYYTKANYIGGHVLSHHTPAEAICVLIVNAFLLLFNGLPIVTAGGNPGLLLLSALAAILASIGTVYSLRRNLSILSIWFPLYVGMVLSWVFFSTRYAVPLFPFIYLMIWNAIRQRREREWTRLERIGGICVLVGALGVNGFELAKGLIRTNATQTPTVWPDRSDNWRTTMELCDWLKGHTPGNSVLSGNADPLLYLYAERKAIRLYSTDYYRLQYGTPEAGSTPIGTAEDMRTNLLQHRVTYIVMTPSERYLETPFVWSLLRELIGRHPSAFSMAHRCSDPRYFVFAVNLDKL